MGQPVLEAVSQRLAELAKSLGFQPLGSGGERHGSWELTFHKRSSVEGELNRYVSVAVTDINDGFAIEARAGADDGGRFTRRVVSRWEVSSRSLPSTVLAARVEEMLECAVEVSNHLGPSDLVEAYLPSRTSRRSNLDR